MKLILLLVIVKIVSCADDFYSILGVTKQSSEREIRKAFKKKALTLHPDKNQDDPDAQAKFIRLNRAYEVLKDEELRKKYDLHGEEGLDSNRGQGSHYHSWNYYRDNFGIYDDDVEIITLNKADFEQSVLGSDVWFINFYHPMCSHCHTLAPIWRRLAQELYGVVRIGAVNCDDTYHLCSSQGIRSYPTLMAYPGRVQFNGMKEKDYLIDFIMSKLDQTPSYILTDQDWKSQAQKCRDKPWLLISNSLPENDRDFLILRTKLKAIFEGMICLGEVHCHSHPKVCKLLRLKDGVYFYQSSDDIVAKKEGHLIKAEDTQEMTRDVLKFLPDIPALSHFEYKELQKRLLTGEQVIPSLILFAGGNDEENLEIRKLPALLPSFFIGKIFCSEMKSECDELFIAKTPSFILFKSGGGYEMHQGRVLAHDIAVFAREGTLAKRFQILTPKEFPSVINKGDPWIIDFFAPWCPPCKRLLPEFRKASQLVDFPMKFGSIDCTMHGELCQRFNIHQYPTTILYNETKPHQYFGQPLASHIVDFVKDTLHPTVITLTEEAFNKRIAHKDPGETWVVDFYAEWCHHCQQMAPEYRRFARLVSKLPNVYIAVIDCARYRSVCQREGIQGYPSIRLYPSGYKGSSYSLSYNEWSRDASSFRTWLYSSLPSEVEDLDDHTFELLLRSGQPWLVDFFAPWCGHCHTFAPEFEDVARELKGKVRCGKINCQTYNWICRGAGVRAYPTVLFYKGVAQKGHRQSPDGIDLDSIDKRDILRQVHKRLSSRSQTMHDEL